MFIVDDVIGEAVSYLFARVEAIRDSHDEAISTVKDAMSKLSASFGDIIEFYRKCSHKLQRLLAANDIDGFWNFFSEMLDLDRLRCFCNEAGVCQDLRIARERLDSLPFGSESSVKQLIRGLATEVDVYEVNFITAIKEYFEKAEKIDLVAAANHRNADPAEVILALNTCLDGLKEQQNKVDSVLQLIRDKAMRSWL